jgi:DNA-binding response OmpR family regulator
MADILLVDDSGDIKKAVFAALGHEHRLEWAKTIGEANDRLGEGADTPDLVLLDIDLPDGDGLEFMRKESAQIEAAKYKVIVISSTDTVESRTKGFELGAIDYIAKPFDLTELMARVRARLRLQNKAGFAPEAPQIRRGSIFIDLARQMAFDEIEGVKKQMPLTPVELRLLILLSRADGRPVARKTILESVWGEGANVSARCVDHHICGLRKKVAPTGHRIESIYGLGYRLSDD